MNADTTTNAPSPAPRLEGRKKAHWIARPRWLKVPDRPSCVAANEWIPILRGNRLLDRPYQSIARALKAAIRPERQTADAIRLKGAQIATPRFFSENAGIFLVHAYGRSRRGHHDAFFYARKQPDAPGEQRNAQFDLVSYGLNATVVQELNTVAPLMMDRHYLAYLRYFMHIVRAEDGGPFRLIDQPDDAPDWPFSPSSILLRLRALSTAAQSMSSLEERLHCPRFEGFDATGRLRYRVCILYSGNLISADIALGQSGSVEMLDDHPLLEVQGLRE
jgi:hypothetical protein